MELEAGMTPQPRLDAGMGMGAVIVHDQVQGYLTAKLPIQAAQELQEFLMTMTPIALTDYFTLQH